MKKLGMLVIVVLILLVLLKSGVLQDERVLSGLETGLRTAVSLLERGVNFLIDKLK
ncbi:MAG: hypothetical protein IKO07_08420 [Clostridia bacterium]|nr:hypothetical protein [Clostridia bacterium]